MAGEEVEYAQSLSRLLDVCTTTAPGAPARDAAAREVENLSRRRSIAFEVDGAVLRVDGGAAVPFDTLGTETLVTAVLSHQVGRLAIRQLTPARDLLEVAALLAAPPVDPQGGVALEEAAATKRLWNIEFVGVASIDAEPVTASLPQDLLASLRDGADYAMAEAALAKLATRGEKALEEGDARIVGAVLARMEDEGAEALFAHLVASQSMNERRAYFDAIVDLGAGAPMLMNALSDAQWYVARNAAELLGAMRVEGAASALAMMLRNADERRRAAAASALARMRTPEALSALNAAVNDPSPQVRYFAHSALIARIEGSSARQLGAALEQNSDGEIKLQIIAALGRLGTPDAIQKLIKQLNTTQPGRGGGIDMTSEFRCASIEAVANARGAAALGVINQFRRDRDPQVRETAQRLYLRLAG